MQNFSVMVVFDHEQRVVISGEVDLATVPQIDDAFSLVDADVFVDCGGVDFIDSSGFHALDRGFEAAIARGSAFSVVGLGELATRVGEILGLPYIVSPVGV